MNKDIYFLHAERFSIQQGKNRFLTAENIRDICNKNNWTKTSLDKVKQYDYLLLPAIYEFKDEEPKRNPEEIKQEIQSLAKELKEMYGKLITEWNNELGDLMDELEKNGEIK